MLLLYFEYEIKIIIIIGQGSHLVFFVFIFC